MYVLRLPPVTTVLCVSCAVWFSGKIYASDLTGPLAGKQVSDLIDYIKNGQAYVSTKGAVRGLQCVVLLALGSGHPRMPAASTLAAPTLAMQPVFLVHDYERSDWMVESKAVRPCPELQLHGAVYWSSDL